ncbi:helix-turn-helix domain-containing protein [Paenibacillus motobuensis]|uniref:helix-turn-helix domain-containing protein n=1 Tax=Paenibacillus TaxID=44249 RepID=UPI00203E5E6C|nr:MULTISPECIES: helix-turn-helix domain-containing protein [Paenibacillus]MCM3042509.1 helix-turn-helix domain-containing protein [Paenibacillus lutimineralis]MCM3649613.1 helix-turn-helix domain-containing protein [Paenibacillus motobuensis]
MEAQNAPRDVPDDEFLNLLQLAKQNDEEAILKLIDLFKGDILRVSKYIYTSEEDAVSDIILELLEMIKEENKE